MNKPPERTLLPDLMGLHRKKSKDINKTEKERVEWSEEIGKEQKKVEC